MIREVPDLDDDPPAHMTGDDLTRWLDHRNVKVLRYLMQGQHDMQDNMSTALSLAKWVGGASITLLGALLASNLLHG
jgi:hypothetical protein